jgi:hypothetical protein
LNEFRRFILTSTSIEKFKRRMKELIQMIDQTKDLQLKVAELEKQLAQSNRELEIEAALERVRARAMGMHNSNELSDVLSVLFEQYDILGISPVFSHLTLFDLEKNKFSYRTTGRKGRRVQAEQKIDMDAVEAWKESVENWKKGGPDQVNAHMYPYEILPYVFQLFQEILSAVPDDAKFYPEDFPNGLYITQVIANLDMWGLVIQEKQRRKKRKW